MWILRVLKKPDLSVSSGLRLCPRCQRRIHRLAMVCFPKPRSESLSSETQIRRATCSDLFSVSPPHAPDCENKMQAQLDSSWIPPNRFFLSNSHTRTVSNFRWMPCRLHSTLMASRTTLTISDPLQRLATRKMPEVHGRPFVVIPTWTMCCEAATKVVPLMMSSLERQCGGASPIGVFLGQTAIHQSKNPRRANM